ncbi:Tyr recombinase domain-containing protein [Vibrio crassostreae]|nr:tyrosine-type recombinase/integrase [Vibrio splendidus]CAK1917644.1 Tyr recombinase domain-containing protein [Vibrio crassostreae]OMO28231.1 integrase [Vibrio splendidus]CAK1919359.1 Tyr recombinase domain-containing protein [Vibrio crassostreae]CAK1938363.1 Tyr recombinase domain-containing protein [Vibrio crassostreae]CAK1941329.1 Tyr recombinase domain-containing protein [Vibrio crassostreae]
MSGVIYEIKSTEIKGFTYKIPLVECDENGELRVAYSKDKSSYVHIKSLTFLNLVGYEKVETDGKSEKGQIVSYEPMDYVNQYILSRHIEEGKEESAQDSKALIHYFSFILDLQRLWDEKYNNEDYDPIIDPSRPAWDSFSVRKNQRATYMYHSAIKKGAIDGTGLAKSTATSYMRNVINFYSYHLRLGKRFNREPFKFETHIINTSAGATYMRSHRQKIVQSTDLKLTFAKSKKNNGGSLPNARRDLKPLTKVEWQEVESILTQTKRVVKSVKGQEKLVSLAEEYCLFFLTIRFTGLRKEEGASLHLGQILPPDMSKPMLRLGVGEQYGSFTKGSDGFNKTRRTIIPSSVMLMLYRYTQSDRYKKRLQKFRELCKAKREAGDDAFFDMIDGVDETKKYLFLSQTGVPFFLKVTELNSRWSEIRKTANLNLSSSFDAVIHNLRSTFAVAIFRMLLKTKDSEKALAIVSEFLGHDDLATTMLYLKIAEDNPTGDEIWEDVLDYLDVFNDIEHELLADPIQPNSEVTSS